MLVRDQIILLTITYQYMFKVVKSERTFINGRITKKKNPSTTVLKIRDGISIHYGNSKDLSAPINLNALIRICNTAAIQNYCCVSKHYILHVFDSFTPKCLALVRYRVTGSSAHFPPFKKVILNQHTA